MSPIPSAVSSERPEDPAAIAALDLVFLSPVFGGEAR
jgi:hypothetical protein